MGEVAEMFDVNASLIRFWEKEFKMIQLKKNNKGNRVFTPKDIQNFNKIYQLVKIEGYTLDGARTALSSKSTTSLPKTDNFDVIQHLEKIKQGLINLKD